MQTIGYIYIQPHGKKILVLVRIANTNATYVSVKLRKSGNDGSHFSCEEKYLETEPDKLKQLLDGKVIKC